jgi:hypothetical protein
MEEEPDNNKMQLTRSAHSRWRPSQLILVLSGPRDTRVTRGATAALLAVAAISLACRLSPEQVRAGWHAGILPEHANLRCTSFSESESYIVFEYEVPHSLATEVVIRRLKAQIEASQWKPGQPPHETCYQALAESATGFTLVCHDADTATAPGWGWNVSVSGATVTVHAGPPAAIAQMAKRAG